MRHKPGKFPARWYVLFAAVVAAVFLLCVCVGSVYIPLAEIFTAIRSTLLGQAASDTAESIILQVRLPRVLCVALVGAGLSLCGAAMQGLLRNPLADVSTLGVSSGACLGAVVGIMLGNVLPFFEGHSVMVMSIVFAFLSLILILFLASRIDYSFSTNTILLIGIVFSMFAQSGVSFLITFAGDKVRSIVFWTMGSLAGSSYGNAMVLTAALLICGGVVVGLGRELNAFAIGEENARHIGINVKRVKLTLMIAVSVITGLCVSVGGTIAFVGLAIPHVARMLVGPNHQRLLPACLFIGAGFLMLADLAARTLLNPVELPIGVITSLIGSVMFIQIFYTIRKAG